MASFLTIRNPNAARRLFLMCSGMPGATVALLAGRDSLAAKSGDVRAGGARILNAAHSAQLEAIAAYPLSCEFAKRVAGLGDDLRRRAEPPGPRRSRS